MSFLHTYRRYRSLTTHVITAMPIVILMPHSGCNCRCIMCDIWKDNKNLRQLTEDDIRGLSHSLKKLGTRQVLMSGGEALLNPHFFTLCEILRRQKLRITLLSTGLTLRKHAERLATTVDDIIISLDGPEELHNLVRNIPGAFQKLKEGITQIKAVKPGFPVTSRTVIHRMNFRQWLPIIESAKELGLNRVSFLPADVSSHAFNREILWSNQRQQEILVDENELPELKSIIEQVIAAYCQPGTSSFVAESPAKLMDIYHYYAAFYGLNSFPFKKCNAPWVSTVVEADGTVRPCFFHEAVGNIHEDSLADIVNNEQNIRFRKQLDMDKNPVCVKCVCHLHLSPRTKITHN